MGKFLDSTGVSHLMSLIKTAIGNKKDKQTAVSDPSANGTGVTFISTASQNENGVISVTKKTVQSASASQAGLMSAEHFSKVDAIPASPKYTDTDTKVTSAANHYTPAKNDDSTLTPTATAEAYALNTEYEVVTGISIERDAKGHVTGASVTKQKVKDTNTHTAPTAAEVKNALGTGTADGTFLNKAGNWTTPAYPVTSVNSKTGAVTLSASDVSAIPTSAKGTANGVATLDSEGKVPSSQLPSFVDDVVEGYYYNSKFYAESAHTTEITGEAGKIYVDLSTNKTYRWGGTAFAPISDTIAIGTTTGTALDGKVGNDHINNTSNPHGVTAAQVGLGNVGNFKAVSTVASQGLTDTEKSNARANIGAGTSSLALGTSSSTAYRGDYGNTAYSHATDANRLTTAKAEGLYKIATTAEGHVKSVTAVAKADITALGIPAQDTTYSEATTSAAGLMSASDKTKLNGIATGATAVTESTVSGWGFTKNTGTLTSHQTIKQNGITGATRNNFAECTIAAATAAKTASVTTGTPTLEKGLHVFVKFANANTASNPTMNINSTGAKAIWYDGAAIGTDPAIKSLLSGVCELEYDGTQWHLLGKMAALTNDDIDTLWAAA